jgi:putative peptidoglycan lipid II flippase
MSYLNTEGSFFVPSLAPAFFNVFSILIPLGFFGYYTARGGDPIFGAAIGVTVGGFMQFIVQIPGLFRKGFHYRFYLSFKDPEFRKVMALFIPVAIGLAGTRINVAVNTVLVSFLGKGSISWLNYAFRIMHLPLGLFGIAVGTVALPAFSRFVIDNNLPEIRRTLLDSLKMVFFLTNHTSVIIACLSFPITRLIYQRGHFNVSDTSATAGALILYILGVPFIAALRNVAAVFYAYRDARKPMYASFVSIGLNVVLNITLMRLVGFLAFPLSTTISAVVNIAILYALLPRRIGAVDGKALFRFFGLLTVGSAVGGAVGWLLNHILQAKFGASLLPTAVSIVVCGALALIVFYGVCVLLGGSEAKDYLRRFTRLK